MPELILDDAAPLKAPKGAGRAVDLDPVAVDLAAVRAASIEPRRGPFAGAGLGVVPIVPLGGRERVPLLGERVILEFRKPVCLCAGDTFRATMPTEEEWSRRDLPARERLLTVYLLDRERWRVVSAPAAAVMEFPCTRAFQAAGVELEFS